MLMEMVRALIMGSLAVAGVLAIYKSQWRFLPILGGMFVIFTLTPETLSSVYAASKHVSDTGTLREVSNLSIAAAIVAVWLTISLFRRAEA